MPARGAAFLGGGTQLALAHRVSLASLPWFSRREGRGWRNDQGAMTTRWK